MSASVMTQTTPEAGRRPKALILCVDALSADDYELLTRLPNFGRLIAEGTVMRETLPVFPSLTYPNHTSIITGCNPGRHGIHNNEDVKAGEVDRAWFNQYSLIQVETLLDIAAKAGLTTGAISWPITGGAPLDAVLPMIVPYHYTGWEPEPYVRGHATDAHLDEYFWRYGYHLMGENRSLDAFTMAVTPDLIRDFGQPDVLLVKLCDLDSARHRHGRNSPQAEEELRRHDQQLGVLLGALSRWGDLDQTVIAIAGDHGIQDVSGVLYLNALLRDAGFLELDGDGAIVDWKAYAHSAGQSAWIQLRDPDDSETRDAVETWLRELVEAGSYGLAHLFTKEQAAQEHGLVGPFDYVVCGEDGLAFETSWRAESAYVDAADEGYSGLRGNHGGLPVTVPTLSLLHGPGVRKGAQIAQASLIDLAPTLARLLGLEFEEAPDGRVLDEAIVVELVDAD
jgi:predicted AlkP superfamily pyrophosphatase or phosphodiesterase